MIFYFQFSPPLAHIFSKTKKEKESTSIEVMMNKNRGSIPTDSKERTLDLERRNKKSFYFHRGS